MNDRRGATAFALQLVLAISLVAASYLVPPWSAAYADVRSWVGRQLWPVGTSPSWPGLAVPLIVLLMVVNQELAIRAIRLRPATESIAGLIGGAAVLGAVSVLLFPGGSHDLELYHAHARMVALAHASPYTTTPAQALGPQLAPTMTWADQLAPYGPLAIGIQAAVVGRIEDPWVAALALKVL